MACRISWPKYSTRTPRAMTNNQSRSILWSNRKERFVSYWRSRFSSRILLYPPRILLALSLIFFKRHARASYARILFYPPRILLTLIRHARRAPLELGTQKKLKTKYCWYFFWRPSIVSVSHITSKVSYNRLAACPSVIEFLIACDLCLNL